VYVFVCVCVCVSSVVETGLYTHPRAPGGVSFGLVAMEVFGSTHTQKYTLTHMSRDRHYSETFWRVKKLIVDSRSSDGIATVTEVFFRGHRSASKAAQPHYYSWSVTLGCECVGRGACSWMAVHIGRRLLPPILKSSTSNRF